MNKQFFMRLFILLLIFFIAKNSLAHKVSVFGYREGNCIKGESYFPDGSPCKGCIVEILDIQGKKLAQTVTNEKGYFKVQTNEKGPIKIKLIAGEGHLAEYEIEGLKESVPKEISENSKFSQNTSKNSSKILDSKIQTSIDKNELNEIIREVVAEETEGIKSMLMDLKKDMNKAKFHEIIGGIGYIFGIWGIIALLKTKNKL